jgi:hypothetical protein
MGLKMAWLGLALTLRFTTRYRRYTLKGGTGLMVINKAYVSERSKTYTNTQGLACWWAGID